MPSGKHLILLVVATFVAAVLITRLRNNRRLARSVESERLAALARAREAREEQERAAEAARQQQRTWAEYNESRAREAAARQREQEAAARAEARSRLVAELKKRRDRARWNPEEREEYEEFLRECERDLRAAGAWPDLQGRGHPEWLILAVAEGPGGTESDAKRAAKLWDLMVHGNTPPAEAESARDRLLTLCHRRRWPTSWSELPIRS